MSLLNTLLICGIGVFLLYQELYETSTYICSALHATVLHCKHVNCLYIYFFIHACMLALRRQIQAIVTILRYVNLCTYKFYVQYAITINNPKY